MTSIGRMAIITRVGALAVAFACVPAFGTTVTVSFTAQQIVNAYNQTYTFSGSKETGTGWLGLYNNGYNNSTLETNFFGRSGVAGAASNPLNGASSAAM